MLSLFWTESGGHKSDDRGDTPRMADADETRPKARSGRPPGRPKGEQSENAERRRKQLVDAAIESIVIHGMSSTTLATVARAAGLSQGVAVFYFKTKENLLIETLRRHYREYEDTWRGAIAAAPEDPVLKIAALVLADLDPAICTRRNLTLWNSYWGEASARPKFAELCDSADKERYDVLEGFCAEAAAEIEEDLWTPHSVADALDTMTDGMWTRMHITPDYMSRDEARELIVRFLSIVFPTRAADIQAYAETPI